MKARLAVLGVVLVVAVFQLSREAGRAVAPARREPETPASVGAPRVAASMIPSASSRDPFRFGAEEPVGHESRAPSDVGAPPLPEPLPPSVRLVGFVRRAGVLRAILAADGEVVLASADDTVRGFRVLSLDEELGVRVRDPEGLEATLVLPDGP
jgi:hypothetical protein